MLKPTKPKAAVFLVLFAVTLGPLSLFVNGPAVIVPVLAIFWLDALAQAQGVPVSVNAASTRSISFRQTQWDGIDRSRLGGLARCSPRGRGVAGIHVFEAPHPLLKGRGGGPTF